MSGFKRITLALCLILFSSSVFAQDPTQNKFAMKEFVRSCTYGVLAGTMVGAATLAFTDKPGDNLNKVARGASLGLYTGILLGIYVVYIVPGQIADEEEGELLGEPGGDDGGGDYDYYDDGGFRFDAFPLISEKGIEGAAVNMRLMTF